MKFRHSAEAVKIAESTLELHVSVDALLKVIDDDSWKFRAGIKNALERPKLPIFDFCHLVLTPQDFQMLSQAEALEKLFERLIGLLEKVREKIDGLTFLNLRLGHFENLNEGERNFVLSNMLEIVAKEALELEDLDPKRDEYLLQEAKVLIYKILGFPRPQKIALKKNSFLNLIPRISNPFHDSFKKAKSL